MERVKYVISGVIRDCLDYPHGFVECVNMFFVPEKKDLFSIEVTPGRDCHLSFEVFSIEVTPGGNYHFSFEVFSEEQREKVIWILEKTVYKYEEMKFCSYE